MKICFLVSSLNAGGAERVATTLCNAWSRRGDNVTLIATFSGGGQPFYSVAEPVELVSLAELAGSTGKGLSSYVKRFHSLRMALKDRKPDVVISFLPPVNVAAILATAFTKLPLIICERNDPSSRSPLDIWEISAKLTFWRAGMMTVQTDAVARRIRSRYPGLRLVRTVPNPLPDAITAYERSVPNGARKILLFMGRLDPQKQPAKAIDAFSQLAGRFSDWDLHVYGEGPLRADLQARIDASKLNHRIMLKGRTESPWDVMAAADAFLMTSRHEGFPNALLEAMGLGLPCVVTDCPSGPREMTRGGIDALLVPNGDDIALVNALERVMGDARWRCKLGARARESVLRRYTLSRVLDIWDAAFSEVMASERSGKIGAWRSS